MDAREGLRQLRNESIDCVVTSPPYWALRDYGVCPTVWGGKPRCTHLWKRERTPRPNGSGAQTGKQTTNRGTYFCDYHDRASYSNFCARCGAWKGCLGLEPTFGLYVQHLCEIFDDVRRVLKPMGTCWLNLGDTYAGSRGNCAPGGIRHVQRPRTNARQRWQRSAYEDTSFRLPSSQRQAVQQKSLCLIPERFVLGMVARGWLLRNRIAWHKPNHMPSSIKDRFACSWEYLFFFVKKRRYYFDLDSVRVPHKSLEKQRAKSRRNKRRPQLAGMRQPPEPGESNAFHHKGKNPGDFWTIPSEARSLGAIVGELGAVKVPSGAGWSGHPPGGEARIVRERDPRRLSPGGRNPGDCWEVPTRPFPGAHFAVFPEKLVETPIMAGCPREVCVKCGTARRRVSTLPRKPEAFNIRVRDVKAGRIKWADRRASRSEIERYHEPGYASPAKQRGVSEGCGCNAGFRRGVVLDPFMGSGTTAIMARKLGRDFIGFELNPAYVSMAEKRLADAVQQADSTLGFAGGGGA